MQLPLQQRLALGAVLVFAALPGVARALEHVELRNGFSYDCTRREILPGGQVRLFLAGSQPGTSEANYIDVPVAKIASVEPVPDLLPAASSADSADSKGIAGAKANLDIPGLLSRAGNVHNIDRELLASIVLAESSRHAQAVSHTGARGLMQLMPGTAHAMGVADAFKPEDNINGGSAYLDLLLTRYRDDLALALAAYNAGPAAVDRFHGIPPFRETRVYVARVMSEFKRRKLALQQAARSATVLALSRPVAR